MTQYAAGLPRLSADAMHSLRASIEQAMGDQAAPILQAAGYAAGPATYRAFGDWLRQNAQVDDPGDLDANYLAESLSAFFTEIGWGGIAITHLGGSAMALDSTDWAEAAAAGTAATPSCHLSTGMLAGFLTELAGDVVAVMQVECLSRGDARCRFLAGSAGTLQAVFDAMTRGEPYESLFAASV